MKELGISLSPLLEALVLMPFAALLPTPIRC
jgi:hypothetical protein